MKLKYTSPVALVHHHLNSPSSGKYFRLKRNLAANALEREHTNRVSTMIFRSLSLWTNGRKDLA